MANNSESGCGCFSEFLFALLVIIVIGIVRCNREDKAKQVTKEESVEYADSSLETGSKPYAEYFGKEHHGPNKITFKTVGKYDYVITIKDVYTKQVINHVYIRGGDAAALTIPNGVYTFGFYTGKGWNSNLKLDEVFGGFVLHSDMQKDDSVAIYNQDAVYTLYPVTNGNLKLDNANAEEIF